MITRRSRSTRGWIMVVFLVVAVVAAVAGPPLTAAYKDWKHAKELARKDEQILAERASKERWKLRSNLLLVKERRGLLSILEKTPAPDSPNEFDMKFIFTEILENQTHALPIPGTLRGSTIHVFGRKILFKDEYADDTKDPSRQTPHLLILDSIRALGPKGSLTPTQVMELDSKDRIPPPYQAAFASINMGNLGVDIRSEPNFWNVMHDEQARRQMGIDSMDATSNGVEPRARHNYQLTFSRAGATLLDVEQPRQAPLAQAPASPASSRSTTTGSATTPMAVALGRTPPASTRRISLLGID